MVVLYWQDDESGQTEFVRFDAVVTEVHEDVVTITEHPVERGANVTDHARPEPERLTIEGVVSNIPNTEIDTDTAVEVEELSVRTMRDPGTRTVVLDVPTPPIEKSISGLIHAGVGALKRSILGAPRATMQAPPQQTTKTLSFERLGQTAPRDRVRDVYELLLKAKERALLVTVSTSVREYYDMLLERIAAPRAVEHGSKVHFELDLRRIHVAESETVAAPEPAEARGQTTKSKGSQAAKQDPNDGKKKERLRSTAHRLRHD